MFKIEKKASSRFFFFFLPCIDLFAKTGCFLPCPLVSDLLREICYHGNLAKHVNQQ